MSVAPVGPRITDVHIHVMPWRMMKPAVAEVIWRDMPTEAARLRAIMDDPSLLLDVMDAEGIERAGLVNYVSPHVMGWTPEVNDFAVRYASHAPARLIPYGGVDPRSCPDAAAEIRRIADLGIRVVKVHPPHMRVAANAYTEGLDALAAIYRECESRGIPVMIHTGTSIFPGARSKYGNPLELDDVAIDFPDLRIIMAHGGRPLWMAEAFFVLRRHANVWLDLSGIPPRRIPEWFPQLERIGDRVLWGTDWPSPGVTSLRRNVEQFLALPYPEAFTRAVLEDNARRLLP